MSSVRFRTGAQARSRASASLPIPSALREARYDLRLSQLAMGEHLSVSRKSIAMWEGGRIEPPLEQGRRILEALADAPWMTRARIAQAFGFPLPPPPAAPGATTTTERAPDAAAQRAAAENAVRVVADEVDVTASLVRRVLAALVQRADEAKLPLDALRTVVAVKRRA